ncbi:MAG: UDP-3-O-acyl-N-acetylglucosamine deacetylase [Rickettsiales bacterium]|jgi:UDP-3-O-[3-hydroxymyristoyl] N-acetylglucosamine deacetylase|nr:UDP-3-O-acyl-N-acetylglucosamine deacetylase [Rickettsiales bacterium]
MGREKTAKTATPKKIVFRGFGIHSGKPATLTVNITDAPGIFFRRVDLSGDLIPATWDNVSTAVMQNTTIGKCPDCVKTIEHLMSALCICGITGAIIDIDGPETPIMDGSAKFFCKKLCEIRDSRFEIRKIIIKKEIIAHRREIIKTMPIVPRIGFLVNNFLRGRKSDGYVKLIPGGDALKINATISYPDKIIGTQSTEFIFDFTAKSRDNFIKNFAAARTFGSVAELEYLKKRDMGRGANLENVIALNESGDGTLNKLHWPDEFVRHKILDTVGDMYLSGGVLIGTVETFKGSHALNNLVLKKLFSDKMNYEITEI